MSDWHLALWAAAAASSACATSGVHEGEARLHAGSACFAPAAANMGLPGVRNVRSVAVYEISAKKASEAWAFAIEQSDNPIRLQPMGCVAYGVEVPGAQRVTPVDLKDRTVYRYEIDTDYRDPKDPAFIFVGKFCLRRSPPDGLTLIQIRPGTTAWRQEFCPDQ